MSLPKKPLGPLKRRDDEPVFDEPWQAQALGMADMLVTARVVSADAWATAPGRGTPQGCRVWGREEKFGTIPRAHGFVSCYKTGATRPYAAYILPAKVP